MGSNLEGLHIIHIRQYVLNAMHVSDLALKVRNQATRAPVPDICQILRILV